MRSDARKRSDNLSLRRGAGSVPSPGGDATTPAVVALTLDERELLGDWWDGGVAAATWGLSTLYPVVERLIADRLAAAGVVSDAAAEEEAVERAAKALYLEEENASMGFDEWPAWESEDNLSRDIFRDYAKAALTAAAAVSGVAASKADTDEGGA